jgi:gamma-glutamyl phosphate reductase
MRFFHKKSNRLALICGFLFVGLGVADLMNLSSLMLCMALGAAVANLSFEAAQIISLAESVTSPIYILFFVASGAGLQVSVLKTVGVIGVIYESRPNVTADAFALCFKAGSAVVLKGGSDAIHSNEAITDVLREALADCGIDPNAVQLIASTDRAATREFMTMRQYVDVLIPRGGAGLIRATVENSKIPVIETGTGNCHIYVDKDADLTKAMPIISFAMMPLRRAQSSATSSSAAMDSSASPR